MPIKFLSATAVAMTLTIPVNAETTEDLPRGRTIGVTCMGCHAGETAIPAIKGRDASALETALLGYKNGERQGTIMPRIAKGYSEADIKAIAAYFASLEK